jgi:hypothetical protein
MRWFTVTVLFVFLHHLPVLAHDNGRYADSSLHTWFEHLSSGKGPCCDYADGIKIEEPDWQTHEGHYRVRVPDTRTPGDPMVWIDVSDDAVIMEPNKDGRAWVWPVYGIEKIWIRCFMPAAMG